MTLAQICGYALCGMTALLAFPARGQGSATVSLQANVPGVTISSNLFGIFFEEINNAGDGGLYAELVQNRSFEDSSNSIPAWTLVTGGSATGQMSLDTSLPLSSNNVQSLKLTETSGSGTVGAANTGYWGIPLTQGATYNLEFYARGDGNYVGPIILRLESADGATVYAQNSVGGLTTNWQHFALPLVSVGTDPAARLALRISQPGSVYLDFVSLFPAQTFKNRPNGLRPDLANMLVGLQPSFVRFPGGAWVDGAGVPNFYNWEVTVGDPANRIPRHDLWGYMVDNGLGYEEYLQMCEDLGATPLFVVNCGMDYSVAVPTNQLAPYVQEALDAIQYANGDTNTFWGAQRAANGHPAPFNLRYLEIGNENGGSAYNDHYAWFYDAIKAQYPYMKLIANSPVTSRPMDILDQHYYSDPSFFENNAGLYDSYSRSGPKIFVGEYAVTSGGGNGNLAGALGEAAFMTGLERNSDVVELASYAPLFCNLNNKDWNPDLIYFTGTQVYGTPSYYVQQMFSANRGQVVLPTTVSPPATSLFVSSSLIPSSGEIIVKAVNVSSSTLATTFNLGGVSSVASTASVIQLTSASPTDENSLADPTQVFPTNSVINNAGTNFTVTLPAKSLSVLRLQASGFSTLTDLRLQFTSPINAGQIVTAAVSAQETGGTNVISLTGNYAVAYASSDTNIVVVDNNGHVAGVSPGNAAVIATYDGLSATQAVQVLPSPPTTLIHRYSFNDGTANDSVGTNNGVFFNASGAASIANGQLNLAGNAGDYVDLGPGVINTTNLTTGAVTFEAWATFNPVNGAWARLFDLGNISGSSGANYIFLAPCTAANGGSARLAVSDIVGNGDETGFDLNHLLGQTNLHVAVVFNPAPGRQFLGLYTNGVLAASAPTGGKTIASINDVFSFLGRSLWSADAWLNGSIDEFRIYNGELDKFQIAASGQAGPNATNWDPGVFTSFVLNAGKMPLTLNTPSQAEAYLNFSLATNVSVIGDPNLTLASDNPAVFTVNASGVITPAGVGTASLNGVYHYVTGNATNTYAASTVVTVAPNPPTTLMHRYSFNDGTADDSVGHANGTLAGNATVSAGRLLIPNATSTAPAADYLQLPPGILTNAPDGVGPNDTVPAVTIEAWATLAPNQYTWANLFDFGTQDASGFDAYSISFCVNTGGSPAGVNDAAISDSDNANVNRFNTYAGPSLGGSTNVHLVVVFNPPANYTAFYTNGVLMGYNNGVTLSMAGINATRNIIGADNWPDAGLQGSVDEFRIYDGALNSNEIAATQILGPNQLLSIASPTLNAVASDGSLTLSWPLAAAGFSLSSRTNLVLGAWTPVSPAPQIVGGQWQVTLPASAQTLFFRLQE